MIPLNGTAEMKRIRTHIFGTVFDTCGEYFTLNKKFYPEKCVVLVFAVVVVAICMILHESWTQKKYKKKVKIKDKGCSDTKHLFNIKW